MSQQQQQQLVAPSPAFYEMATAGMETLLQKENLPTGTPKEFTASMKAYFRKLAEDGTRLYGNSRTRYVPTYIELIRQVPTTFAAGAIKFNVMQKYLKQARDLIAADNRAYVRENYVSPAWLLEFVQRGWTPNVAKQYGIALSDLYFNLIKPASFE